MLLRFAFLFSLLFSSSLFANCHEEPINELTKEHPISESEEITKVLESTPETFSWKDYLTFRNVGIGGSIIFIALYYKTGNAYAAAVAMFSLGMLFVCRCNGSIKFGVCPQQAALFASGTLALIYAREVQNPNPDLAD